VYLSELQSIVERIIRSRSLVEHVAAAKELSGFYKRITADDQAFNLPADNEKSILGGQALSTLHAADCTDDYLRTVFFIKGVNKAVNRLCADNPERQVNIVYAGCGPFATLLIPLLSIFSKNQICAILLDINNSSIHSVKKIISILGLNDYQLMLIEADATTYQKPESFAIDLLLSETMHYALTSEPQVSIIKNFLPQLHQQSIIIPQEISIDLAYSFYSKEPFLKDADTLCDNDALKPYPMRSDVGNLFKLSKNFNQLSATPDNKIISSPYLIPEEFSEYPDICLFTSLKIYDDIELNTAESYITNPYCVTSLFNIKAHLGFQLIYDYNEVPKWTCKLL